MFVGRDDAVDSVLALLDPGRWWARVGPVSGQISAAVEVGFIAALRPPTVWLVDPALLAASLMPAAGGGWVRRCATEPLHGSSST
jgi:hypothetical protein